MANSTVEIHLCEKCRCLLKEYYTVKIVEDKASVKCEHCGCKGYGYKCLATLKRGAEK